MSVTVNGKRELMESKQEDHLAQLIDDFSMATDLKYRKGQKEHGGNLRRKSTLVFMEEEILDFWTYYHVHKEHISDVVKILDDVLKDDTIESNKDDVFAANEALIEAVRKVRNILVIGNEEGIKEEGD